MFFPSSARPRGCAPPAPAGEANHVCAAWSPRAGAGGWGWAAAAGTLLGRRVHTDTPAPASWGLVEKQLAGHPRPSTLRR